MENENLKRSEQLMSDLSRAEADLESQRLAERERQRQVSAAACTPGIDATNVTDASAGLTAGDVVGATVDAALDAANSTFCAELVDGALSAAGTALEGAGEVAGAVLEGAGEAAGAVLEGLGEAIAAIFDAL